MPAANEYVYTKKFSGQSTNLDRACDIAYAYAVNRFLNWEGSTQYTVLFTGDFNVEYTNTAANINLPYICTLLNSNVRVQFGRLPVAVFNN